MLNYCSNNIDWAQTLQNTVLFWFILECNEDLTHDFNAIAWTWGPLTICILSQETQGLNFMVFVSKSAAEVWEPRGLTYSKSLSWVGNVNKAGRLPQCFKQAIGGEGLIVFFTGNKNVTAIQRKVLWIFTAARCYFFAESWSQIENWSRITVNYFSLSLLDPFFPLVSMNATLKFIPPEINTICLSIYNLFIIPTMTCEDNPSLF